MLILLIQAVRVTTFGLYLDLLGDKIIRTRLPKSRKTETYKNLGKGAYIDEVV